LIDSKGVVDTVPMLAASGRHDPWFRRRQRV